jgi:putative hydrolase of the HAD superfamily
MIKAIIFDADGMVVSSKMFSEELEKDFGISTEKLLPFFKSAFTKCLIGKADLIVELKPYLEEWGWKGSAEELTDYWFKAEHEIDDGLVAEIERLKQRGVKCYLATNQELYRTNYMRDCMGFGELFDEIWSSAEIGFKKPSQEFFQSTFEHIQQDIEGVAKTEVMFWDDDKENARGAAEFGYDAHRYRNIDSFLESVK